MLDIYLSTSAFTIVYFETNSADKMNLAFDY